MKSCLNYSRSAPGVDDALGFDLLQIFQAAA